MGPILFVYASLEEAGLGTSSSEKVPVSGRDYSKKTWISASERHQKRGAATLRQNDSYPALGDFAD